MALIASWTVERGRRGELDKIGPGVATVTVNDVDGVLDPTNPTGPYYGSIKPMRQAALELWNPVTEAYSRVFRGYIKDLDYVVDPSQKVMRLVMSLVDAKDYFAAYELAPGAAGNSPPAGSEGNVFYEDAEVDDRINQLLADVGWPVGLPPSGLSEVFSGNVVVQETVYAPGTQALTVLEDAADAEFPAVASLYVSREGVVTFHGRQARFRPAVADYHISHWKCGDGAAVALDSDLAQVRGFGFNMGTGPLINAALATPQNIADADIPGQIVTDPSSITAYGVRSWSAENLLTAGSKPSTTNEGDPLAETLLFGTYYVNNYAEPRGRVNQVVFRSMRPGDPRAAKTWQLICGVEINDLLDITVSHPGGGGIDETYFIEGIQYDMRPANKHYHDVTLTLDVSPKAYFDSNPFEDDPDV